MGQRSRTFVVCLLFFQFICSARLAQAAEGPFEFQVRLGPVVGDKAYTGRVSVFLTQGQREPRFGPNWFRPEPFFATDVTDVQAGQVVRIDDRADGFPDVLSALKPGRYNLQAVLDHDFYSPHAGRGAGNFYSDVVSVTIDPKTSDPLELVLNQKVEEAPFPETKWVKEIVLSSRLLSEYHQRPVVERAAVILPESYYREPGRRYPVLYTISGFGGNLRSMAGRALVADPTRVDDGTVEFIHVLLTGECKWGHHVYANSQTNGPRGDTLVTEMIPTIDETFRTVADVNARFVAGHSSGGWASLWLQVAYPEVFGGVWSTSPDPVDFRDFQGTDLYAVPPQSVYFDAQGKPRPLARQRETPVLWFPGFAKMDDCIGRGGQLRSFEAVFSPLDSEGLPAQLWEREQGRINPEVAEAWKQYDIGLVLEQQWQELAPKLRGKLHVTMGTLDTFYLNGATELLKERLERLGSDAEIVLVPDEGHSFSAAVNRRVRAEREAQMSAIYLSHFKLDGSPK